MSGLNLSIRRPLADAENDEFRRAQGRHADQADQTSVVQIVLRHRRAVAFDKKCLLWLFAEQRAAHPFAEQKILDGAADVGPQKIAVRLEDRPLRALVD